MTATVTSEEAAKTTSVRWFFLRAIILTIIFTVLLSVIGALFDSSSDSDFGPARPGSVFAFYHSTLAAILAVLLAPMWLLESIQRLVGFDFMRRDVLCLIFSSACYGFLISCVWLVIARIRSKSHATEIA